MDFSIGFLRRQASALFAEQEQPPLALCQSCGSEFVQPQAWKELPSGDLLLHLRCPECLVVTSGVFDHERVVEYDQLLIEGKQATIAEYDSLVRHNMEELLERFKSALELDLIGAGDFEPSPARRDTGQDRGTLQVESSQRR